MKYFIHFWRHYADFSGRATRTEYWLWWPLFQFIIYMILFGIAFLLRIKLLIYIDFFAVLISGLAVSVRRLRDAGKSPWWVLLSLIPYVGGLILLIFCCLPSKKDDKIDPYEV